MHPSQKMSTRNRYRTLELSLHRKCCSWSTQGLEVFYPIQLLDWRDGSYEAKKFIFNDFKPEMVQEIEYK